MIPPALISWINIILLLIVPVGLVGVAVRAGYRMGLRAESAEGRWTLTPNRDGAVKPLLDTDDDADTGINWSKLGLRLSLLFLIIALGGFGIYYVGVQGGNNALTDETQEVTDAQQSQIDQAKQALKNNSKDSELVEISTKDWATHTETNVYTLIHPTDYTKTTGTTAPGFTAGQTTHAALNSLTIRSSTNEKVFLTATTYENKDGLEPGAFSSISAVHDLANETERIPYRIIDTPAVKYITIRGTDRVETTYVSNLGATKMVVLQLHGNVTDQTDQTLEWRTMKQILAKFRFTGIS